MKRMILSCVLAAALAGCATPPRSPNRVEIAARGLAGQPLEAAIDVFGPPLRSIPPTNGRGGMYSWDSTAESYAGQRFVATGSEYAGRAVVGMAPQGPNGPPVPVFQDQYRDVGHYEDVRRIDYLCMVFVYTDARDVIQKATVAGCAD